MVFPRLAVLVSRRAADIRDSLRLYARVCVPAAVVIMTAPSSLVSHLFPASYGNVASILPWAALAGLGIGLVNLTTTYFQAAGIIRRPTLTLAAGIVAGAGLDYIGMRAAGPKGLALAVAVQGAAVSAALLRDCHRIWPGALRSLWRTAAASVLLGGAPIRRSLIPGRVGRSRGGLRHPPRPRCGPPGPPRRVGREWAAPRPPPRL